MRVGCVLFVILRNVAQIFRTTTSYQLPPFAVPSKEVPQHYNNNAIYFHFKEMAETEEKSYQWLLDEPYAAAVLHSKNPSKLKIRSTCTANTRTKPSKNRNA